MSIVLYMDVQVVCIMLGGRAVRSHICSLDEVTNTPGVQYIVPTGLFTHIIYTRNVGSHILYNHNIYIICYEFT